MRKPHSPTKKSGFTLIELLAVIAIFSIIVAIMIPTLHPPTTIDAKIDSNLTEFHFSETADPLSLLKSEAKEHFVVGPLDERPPMVALDGGDTLVLFDADTPGTVVSRAITGLEPGEEVLAFDTQISSTFLYGVTNCNRIVRITPSTGAAVHSTYMGAGVNDAELKMAATMYNFYIDSEGCYENPVAPYEKWVRSDVMNTAGNAWFYILPNGELHEWDGSDNISGALITKVGIHAYENPELLGAASQTVAANPAGALAADNTRHFYRSSTGNFAYNAMGGNEKWLKGEIAQKSAGGQNNNWYFILPNGDVREWDGSANLTGALVGNFGVGVYERPSLLYDANLVNLADSNGNDLIHNFFFDRFGGSIRNLYEDDLPGLDVKWFIGDHNQYFLIRTDGTLVAWDGGAGPTGVTLGNLGPDAWDNIEQVVNDIPAPLAAEAPALDFSHSIFRDAADGNFYYNAAGQMEKWVRCDRTAKTTGATNPWLVILPTGDVIEWDGGAAPITGNVIGTFPSAYDDPSWLCDAYCDGTALSSSTADPYAPAAPVLSGNRLNDALLDVDLGIGADIFPSGNFMVIATGNLKVYACDVLTGMSVGLPDVTLPVPVCGIAFTDAGDARILSNHIGFDRFSSFNIITGVPTAIANTVFDGNERMGLEIIGNGIPGGGDVLGVNTVFGGARLIQYDLNTGATVYLGEIGAGLTGVTDLTINCETP